MDLKQLKKEFDKLNEKLSRALSAPKVSLEEYAVGLSFARMVEKTFDPKDPTSITAVCKEKIVEVVKSKGMKKPDAASTVYTFGSWVFSMYPSRTGTDPKKLQARLIAKELSLKKWMKEVPTYEVDPALVFKAVKEGVLTEQEIKECEYDESWTVKTPKLEE